MPRPAAVNPSVPITRKSAGQPDSFGAEPPVLGTPATGTLLLLVDPVLVLVLGADAAGLPLQSASDGSTQPAPTLPEIFVPFPDEGSKLLGVGLGTGVDVAGTAVAVGVTGTAVAVGVAGAAVAVGVAAQVITVPLIAMLDARFVDESYVTVTGAPTLASAKPIFDAHPLAVTTV